MAALFPCIQTPSHPTSWPWSPGFIIVLSCIVSPFWSRCLDFSSEECVHKEGPRSLVHEEEEDVYTLDEWKAVLGKDFLELKQLEGQDASTRMRRSMKEQEIGQHCCQAGESLGDPDLALLKETLGLDEWQWHAYRAKVRPAHD